jgi:hypothetical protein
MRCRPLARAPLACRPLLLVCVVAIGCSGPVAPEPRDLTIEGTWAGEAWRGDGGATIYSEGDSLSVWGGSPPHPANAPSPEPIYLTSVYIRVAFDGPGSYALDPGMADVIYLVGGDVLTARYAIPDGQTGTLVIEEVTETRIRGNVAFDTGSIMELSPAGESARFEATFDAPLTSY